MSEYLTFEDLKKITSRTGERVTKAQVIADLTMMNFPFEVNPRGYPFSSTTALNKVIGLKGSNKTAAKPKPRRINVG